jgi:6,7-dimethyl-8-ribityllumazine synthase
VTAPHAKPTSTSRAVQDRPLSVGIVRATWNTDIVERLAAGAHRALDDLGVSVREWTVAGAFELPFAASVVARSGDVDAIVVLGCVIRGETTHYELVADGCASGVMRVQLDTHVPIGFGVLTVEDHDQALVRSGGPGEHNVGDDAARAAVDLAVLT